MMQGNGARVIATVAICMGLIVVWPYIFGLNKKKKDKDERPAVSAVLDGGAGDGGETPAVVGEDDFAGADGGIIDGAVFADGAVAPAVVVAPTPKPVVLDKPVQPKLDAKDEKTVVIDTPLVRAEFTSFGGAIKSWQLKHSQYYEYVGGKKVQIDMVRHLGQAGRYAMTIATPEGTARLPEVPLYDCKVDGPYKVTCVHEPKGEGLAIERTYTMDPDTYVLDMAVKMRNATKRVIIETLEVRIAGFQDPEKKTRGGMFSRPQGDTAQESVCHFNGKRKYLTSKKLDKLGATGSPVLTGKVRFSGVTTKYFVALLVPHRDSSPEARQCLAYGMPGRKGAFASALRFAKSGELKPGEFQEVAVGAYFGPKILSQLESVRFEEGENPKLGSTVSLGWSLVSPISRLMLWILRSIHNFVPNWGLCIILLTLLVKLLTLPLMTKQMRSMKAMQKLKPEMDKIKAKYKGDKQKEQIATMELYKSHKINPLGGCLPTLIQAPIWIALYGALGGAAELFQAPFAGWLDNLTSPDPYYITPLLLGGLTFVQQKITPQPVDNQQAKIMMYMMPIMFTVFALFFPSGLSLYMLTNTILTGAHQYYMNRGDKTVTPSPKKA